MALKEGKQLFWMKHSNLVESQITDSHLNVKIAITSHKNDEDFIQITSSFLFALKKYRYNISQYNPCICS